MVTEKKSKKKTYLKSKSKNCPKQNRIAETRYYKSQLIAQHSVQKHGMWNRAAAATAPWAASTWNGHEDRQPKDKGGATRARRGRGGVASTASPNGDIWAC